MILNRNYFQCDNISGEKILNSRNGQVQIVNIIKWNPSNSVPTSDTLSRLILGLRPANDRRRYKVTPSLIGWAQT